MSVLKYKANDVIKFDDQNSLRKINSGTVDFYLIEKNQDPMNSHRRYVFTLNENCFFPVFETEHKNGPFCLIGMANDKVEIVEQKKLDISMCDSAMNTLEKCLPASNKLDSRAVKITALSTLELDPDEHMLNNSNAGVWVTSKTGEVCINSYKELSIAPGSGFLPLPQGAYVAANTYCRLATCSNEELIAHEDAIQSIQKCIQISLNITLDSILKQEFQEFERILNRNQNNEAEFDTSLRDLSKIFEENKDSKEVKYNLHSVLIPICRELGVKLKIPSDGTQNVTHILEATGLRSRGVLLKDKWWSYNCGVLLAWKEEDSEPVALIPRGHGYRMYTAGKSSVKVTSAVAATLKSNAISMYVPLPAHSLSATDILKYVLRCINPYDTIMYVFTAIGVSLLSLAIPAITEELFGVIVPRQDISGLVSIAVFLFATVAASLILKISQHISHLLFETKSGVPLQAAVWDRLYHLPVKFFKKYETADILRRASGVESMQKLFTESFIQGIFNIVALISGFILMLQYNAKLAAVLFVLNIIAVLPLIKTCFSIGHAEHAIAEEDAKSTGALLHIIQGIAKFRTTSTETKAFSLWEKNFAKLLRISYKRDRKESIALSIASIIPSIFLLILYILNMTGKFGSMSMGTFLAFSAAFAEVSNIIVEFCHSAIELGEVEACYQHLDPIIKACPEGYKAAACPEVLKGNIELKNITFRYSSDLPTVLRGLSVSVPAGKCVAITGPSGCGKSTLVRLLLGYETPEAGLISYDGQDISLIDCSQLRRQLGVVLQNGKIFADDILANITGKSSSLTVDDAWLAAETAELAEDINNMSMGMYTVLEENGISLSSGQKQRLLIARALANHPRILIFDEATSTLDNKTQAVITSRIEKMKCTRIIISQRLNSIKNADKIYYLDDGAVAEEGTYKELMDKKGLFYEMASFQLK